MPLIRLENIVKIYPGGTVAVDNACFEVEKGEVHALLGENGAGKTTLMKILSGCLKPTSGSIYVDGRRVEFRSPAHAMKYGIGMLHQHFTLIPNMSVLENVMLGLTDQDVKKEKLLKDIERISKFLRLNVDLRSPVHVLSVGEKQKVEIMRMMLLKARILIFDEPTSSICGPDAENFLDMLKKLASEGYGIVLITHKIREALKVCDRVTVMRKGKTISTLKRDEIKDERVLLEMMLGEHFLPEVLKQPREEYETPLLIVKDLVVKNDQGVVKVNRVSFEVRKGEIFGLIGVEGNGQKELIESITGLRKQLSGQIIFNNSKYSSSPSYIPEERMEVGVAPSLSVMKNAVLRDFEREEFSGRYGILKFSKIGEITNKIIHFMDVRTPNMNLPVKYLSGGNIQKLIVGRELMRGSELLIAEQPTAGLDVRSAYHVRKNLLKLASMGVGILLVSSDIDEVLEVCDRVAVMRDGRIVRIFNASEADPKRIGMYMLAAEVGLSSQ
ncbi:MAG: ABC transporter ATP-binding protein [Nitrososphaerota archaeon]|nr:ABC transporter ATP-binding protein [Nitrososphaerota archaeon]